MTPSRTRPCQSLSTRILPQHRQPERPSLNGPTRRRWVSTQTTSSSSTPKRSEAVELPMWACAARFESDPGMQRLRSLEALHRGLARTSVSGCWVRATAPPEPGARSANAASVTADLSTRSPRVGLDHLKDDLFGLGAAELHVESQELPHEHVRGDHEGREPALSGRARQAGE